VETLDTVASLYDELEDDQEMISLQQFGLLVIDWTNPLKAAEVYVYSNAQIHFSFSLAFNSGISDATNHDVHAHLGVDILLALRDSERPGIPSSFLLISTFV
jgi:condensin complex subunit 3